MAKLCFTLERPHETLQSLESILSNENKQPVQQQLSSLMDYIHIRKVCYTNSRTRDIIRVAELS